MDKQYLNDEFNRFFEFPTEDKSHVSSVSAKLFVEHIAYPLEREIEQLRQRVAELEERRCEVCGYAEHHREHTGCLRVKVKELTAERDALKQQRDELLAALGSGGRHCNDDTPHSNLCEAIIDSKEADLGQGLDPFWK